MPFPVVIGTALVAACSGAVWAEEARGVALSAGQAPTLGNGAVEPRSCGGTTAAIVGGVILTLSLGPAAVAAVGTAAQGNAEGLVGILPVVGLPLYFSVRNLWSNDAAPFIIAVSIVQAIGVALFTGGLLHHYRCLKPPVEPPPPPGVPPAFAPEAVRDLPFGGFTVSVRF